MRLFGSKRGRQPTPSDPAPDAQYEWEAPPPHPCCLCGWRRGEAGVPLEDAVWLWSVPDPTASDTGLARSGLDWVCALCGELNIVCATEDPWTSCPGCGKTSRADLPWNIDCTAAPSDTLTLMDGPCVEDHDRARTILANAQGRWTDVGQRRG